MEAVLEVFPGAERVCPACAVRFNTVPCPACGEAPAFERCDAPGRAWLRERRRARVESPHRARRRLGVRANPPPFGGQSPLSVIGTLGLAAATNALAWVVTASPLVAVVAGAVVGVTGAVGLSLSRRRPREDVGPCVLDAGGAGDDGAAPPDGVLRGVLSTPGRARAAPRWAVRGEIRNVAVADLLGPPMTLRTPGGDDYRFELEGATLVVEGPTRVRTPSQLRVGRHLHALGWLQGSNRDPLTAIALHDGVEVEVRADFDDPSRRVLEPAAFRCAPRELKVRPREGVVWLRVLRE